MGLDIIALRQAKLREDAKEDTAYEEGLTFAYPNPAFPGRDDGLAEGYYASEERMQFRAGSYSGYNRWREWLSETMLGVPPETVWAAPAEWADKPFFELIYFADNEGVIGPKTSAALAADFREHADRALATDDDYFVELYGHWQKAFEMAADDGLVQFA
jgi:hypothetical protein